MGEERLKRAFSGVALTTNDLRTLVAWGEQVAAVEIHANSSHVQNIEELEQIMIEDVVLERCELRIRDLDDFLVLSYEEGILVLRCDAGNLKLASLFARIRDLLAAKVVAGRGRGYLTASPPKSWTPPPAPTKAAKPATISESEPSTSTTSKWWRRLPLMGGHHIGK